jgi:hypothetical protein
MARLRSECAAKYLSLSPKLVNVLVSHAPPRENHTVAVGLAKAAKLLGPLDLIVNREMYEVIQKVALLGRPAGDEPFCVTPLMLLSDAYLSPSSASAGVRWLPTMLKYPVGPSTAKEVSSFLTQWLVFRSPVRNARLCAPLGRIRIYIRSIAYSHR